MSTQQALDLEGIEAKEPAKAVHAFDADELRRRFVDVTPANGERWRVGGMGRRSGQIGENIAILGFKHGNGYEVVLRFEDGKLDAFTPSSLFPAI